MIAVVGSINMDLVVEVERFPLPGETVLGLSFHRYPGGKGANQAVAAARMGADVTLYGKLGADPVGTEVLRELASAGVLVEGVRLEDDVPTGCASVSVAPSGENTVVYVPGANDLVDEEYIDRFFDHLANASVLLIQFEVPFKTVVHMLRRLPRPGPTLVVDPAPARDIQGLLLDRIDVLTPNRHELAALTGDNDFESAAQRLLDWGVRCVVCKDGMRGAQLVEKGSARHFPAYPVEAVDSTAAGDAFNGALGAMLARGFGVAEAIPWANAAGALAATRRGAQPSLPTLAEVRELVCARDTS